LPTLEELYMFRASGFLHESTFRRILAAITQTRIKVHDRVQVVCGTYRGLVGQVVELSEHDASVFLPSQSDTANIAINELQAHICIGDEVTITQGVHKNKTGWVVEV
ncbi:hypothetical protein BDN70DRAFT_780691, partial [Pholiota conissans]